MGGQVERHATRSRRRVTQITTQRGRSRRGARRRARCRVERRGVANGDERRETIATRVKQGARRSQIGEFRFTRAGETRRARARGDGARVAQTRGEIGTTRGGIGDGRETKTRIRRRDSSSRARHRRSRDASQIGGDGSRNRVPSGRRRARGERQGVCARFGNDG